MFLLMMSSSSVDLARLLSIWACRALATLFMMMWKQHVLFVVSYVQMLWQVADYESMLLHHQGWHLGSSPSQDEV